MQGTLGAICSFFTILCSLSACFGQDAAIRVDVNGDALPRSAVARLGALRFRQGESILTLASFPNQKKLVTVAFGRIHTWDLTTGRELMSAGLPFRDSPGAPAGQLKPDDRPFELFAVEVSSDEAKIVLHDIQGRAYVFDAKLDQRPTAINKLYKAVCFAGNILVGLTADNIIERRRCSGELISRFEVGHPAHFLAANDRMIVAASKNGKITVFPEKGETRSLDVETKELQEIILSRTNGVLIAVGSIQFRHFCTAWTHDFKNKQTIQWKGQVRAALSSDGKLLATWQGAGSKAACQVRQTTSLDRFHQFEVPAGYAQSIEFAEANRTLVLAYSNGVISTWDVSTGRRKNPDVGHPDAIHGVGFHKQEIITACKDGVVRFWDPIKQTQTHSFVAGQSILSAIFDRGIVYLPDRPAGWSTGKIAAWDLASKQKGRSFDVRRLMPNIGGSGTKKRPGESMRALPLSSYALSRDGKTLALGAGNYKGNLVQLIDAENGKDLKEIALTTKAKPPSELTFASSETLLARQGELIYVLDVKQAAIKRKIEVGIWPFHRVLAASPDGKHLATPVNLKEGLKDAVGLFEIETGKLIEQVAVPGRVSVVAFLDANTVLLGGANNGMIWVWDRSKKQITKELHGHRGTINVITVAPDRRTFASGGTDTTVIVWDAAKIRSEK